MDPMHKCVQCGHAPRFFCECAGSVTFLCPGCVTAHLGQMQNLVHQVQNLPNGGRPPGRADAEPLDLMKILCERPPLSFVCRVNSAMDSFDTEKPEHKLLMMARQNDTYGLAPLVSEVEFLTRGLQVDDLFLLSHSHSSKNLYKGKNKLGLFTYQPGTRNICFFSPAQGNVAWRQTSKAIPSGAGLCLTCNSTAIMCTGGYTDEVWLSQAFNIDANSLLTCDLMRMLVERECHGAVEYKDHVYVFGGVNASGLLNHCERYSFSTKQWLMLPPLDKRISKTTPVLINNRIYLAGFNSTAVLEFNPATLKSKSLFAGMLSLSEAVCAFTCEEHLFLLQGAFLICADVSASSNTQPARRKADHRHWYSPTPLAVHDGCVYFCRWYEEIWEFGLEHCTMRHLLTLDFTQFS